VLPVSASVNTHYSPVIPIGPDAMTRAITTEEASALAQSFGYAAMRCREGGADCVELHGHEGYLLDQFMTPCGTGVTTAMAAREKSGLLWPGSDCGH